MRLSTMLRRARLATVVTVLPTMAVAAPLTVHVVGADQRPVVDAVVGMQLRGARSTAAAGVTVELAQRKRNFDPGLLAVQTGTGVLFPNFDTVRHHVYSFSPVKRFEITLYAGTPVAPVVFDRPGVATLGCNIHDRMSARIVVMDTPHLARTDAQGNATFEAPAGEHVLLAWVPGMADNEPFVQRRAVHTAAAQTLTWQVPRPAP